MANVLLAVGDGPLCESARRCLEQAGHCVLRVERPLALLSPRVTWDVALLDGSELGRDALTVLEGAGGAAKPRLGLGLEDGRLQGHVTLPLEPSRLREALDGLLARTIERLTLRRERRVAMANGREVPLTRSELRLLEALLARWPREVTVAEAMEAVWGASGGAGTPGPLRAHVRNLRQKLAQIGLGDAVVSRRGRGYLLAL